MLYEIARDVDGRACAEEAGMNAPRSTASSDLIIDEFPGTVATIEMIDHWLSYAKPGEELVYATRCWLPAKSAGAAHLRTLAGQGLVHLKQRPIAGRPERNYVAERSSRRKPLVLATKPTRGISPQDRHGGVNDDVTAMNAVLPLLARAARFERPCPTDRKLAERAGLSVEAVAHALDSLRSAGLIRVDGVKAPTLRQVTIVATGHRTGMIE